MIHKKLIYSGKKPTMWKKQRKRPSTADPLLDTQRQGMHIYEDSQRRLSTVHHVRRFRSMSKSLWRDNLYGEYTTYEYLHLIVTNLQSRDTITHRKGSQDCLLHAPSHAH